MRRSESLGLGRPAMAVRDLGAEAVADDDVDFAARMQALTEALGEQMAKGAEQDQLIRQKLAGLGYEF